MSLHLKFTRADGNALGTFDDVRQAIVDLLPNVRIYQKPGGQQKIADLESRGLPLPQMVRKIFESMPSWTVAEYGSSKEPLLCFVLGSGGELRHLKVSVKGDLAAADAILQRLAQAQGWSISEFSPSDANGTWNDAGKLP
ncbi:MAG TPA: hypothetical protein VH370_25385 [Humisphaera sp.]|jgi:hypothetical protein|nr:hypothetical protein [Humisphaera sp.]